MSKSAPLVDLKRAARQTGKPQWELAQIMDVSEPYISRWINRRDLVPERYRKDFAKLIGVRVADLLPPTTQGPGGAGQMTC